MNEIIFLMEVNKYFGIIYRPYNHAATLLIIEFQTIKYNHFYIIPNHVKELQ